MPATAQPSDPSVESGFDQDWTAAQQRYASAITAGYDADDAKELYLDPVKQKYQILANVPPQQQKQAANELDQSRVNLFRNFESGYTLDDSKKMTTEPTQDKWEAAASIRQPAKPDPLIDEKVGALSEVAAGYDPQQVLQGHPRQIFADPEFVQKFETTADRGQRDRRARESKAANVAARATAEKSFDSNVGELSHLTSLMQSPRFQIAAPDVQTMVSNRLSQVEGNIRSNPLMQPKDDSTPDLGNAPAQPADAKYLTKFKTAADVKAAFHTGELKRDEAKKILQDQFGFQ